MKRALAFAIWTATAGFAAAETWQVNGTATGMNTSTMYPVTEDHTLGDIHSAYTDITLQDASNPMHGATGDCFGAVEIIGVAISGGGNCLFSDAEGDRMVIEWTAQSLIESGGNAGIWQLTGGSGKFAGASGGGEYATSTDAEGTETNNITGVITLR